VTHLIGEGFEPENTHKTSPLVATTGSLLMLRLESSIFSLPVILTATVQAGERG